MKKIKNTHTLLNTFQEKTYHVRATGNVCTVCRLGTVRRDDGSAVQYGALVLYRRMRKGQASVIY